MDANSNVAGRQPELVLRVRDAYLRTRELRARLSAIRAEQPHLQDDVALSLSERSDRQAAERERLEAEHATKRELDAAERELSDAEAAVQESLSDSGSGNDWMQGTSAR